MQDRTGQDRTGQDTIAGQDCVAGGPVQGEEDIGQDQTSWGDVDLLLALLQEKCVLTWAPLEQETYLENEQLSRGAEFLCYLQKIFIRWR